MAHHAGLQLVEGVMLVTLGENVTDDDILSLQSHLADRVHRARARAVVIDIAALDVVDTFVGRIIGQLAGIGALLDARTFLVGMRPAVAMSLVELGMTLPDIHTARNVQHALDQLRRLPG